MSSDEHLSVSSFREVVKNLSAEEIAKLEKHLQQCPSCHELFSRLDQMIEGDPSVISEEKKRPGKSSASVLCPNRYRERFVAAARERGINFSAEALRGGIALPTGISQWIVPRYNYALIIVLLLGAVTVTGYQLREGQGQTDVLVRERDSLLRQKEDLRADVARLSEAARSLESALRGAREARVLAQASAARLDGELKRLSVEVGSLEDDVNLGRIREAELQNQVRDAERLVAQMSRELQELRAGREANIAEIAAQRGQIRELSEQLAYNVERLDRQRRFLATDRDIRDLMGARSLHIIDVFDVDGKGKTEHAFGRVFYTEGKSLLFYAFDLDERKLSRADYSFQAWGYREPYLSSVRSLGIFFVDDEEQRRWVLKFDNPEVLREIDAVFVTVEPFGGGTKPTGDKLLYAYLRNSPNHP
jgi:ribosomal protein L34E